MATGAHGRPPLCHRPQGLPTSQKQSAGLADKPALGARGAEVYRTPEELCGSLCEKLKQLRSWKALTYS